MKILFVVTGIGYGDAIREHANILAFKKMFPSARIMVAGYDNSYDYFKNKYDTIHVPGYKLPGSAMKISVVRFALKNIFLPAFWFLGTLKVRLHAHNFIPDLIVSDFEPIGISLARVLGKKCVVVFGFDPLLYREYAQKNKVNYKMKVEAKYFEKLYDQADVVLIPSFRREKKHILYSYVPPVVRTLPEQLPSEQQLMKELKLKNKPFLIMLGGSNFGTKLAKSMNVIAREYPQENFIIFGGDLDISLAKNVRYIHFTPDFLKYLKVCKGVITLAGQKTLSEAGIYKKPVLCYPIQDHIEQILNAYALRNSIMVSHDSSSKAVAKNFASFIQRLPELEKKMKELDMHGDGSQQIVQILGSILKK
ncbi:hypothetical protein HZA98_03935 [Candidatus Woesearchaeota archaeon]|nr:hypothetical protein [Candidatus Woesearchaeota archaeon]